MRLSYNIDAKAVNDKPYLLAHLAKLRPATTLVMDNLSFAGEVYQHAGGIVIHRNYHPQDGNEWKHRTPQEIVNQWQNEGQKHIYRYDCNEPSGITTPSYLTWLITLMDLAYQSGFRVVVGNWSVGSYEPAAVAGGVFDGLLQALDKYKGWHIFGLHEYTAITLPYGISYWPDSYLLDRDKVQPQNWPRIGKEIDGVTHWHLRRCDLLTQRSRELGLSDPDIILTEFGVDRMGDVQNREPYVYDQLTALYGTSGYETLRGFNSHEAVYRYYWPQWTYARAVYEQLVWADSIYPDNVLGMQLFTWAEGNEWDTKYGFNMGNKRLEELHRMLEAYAVAQPEPPADDKTGCLPDVLRFLSSLLGEG